MFRHAFLALPSAVADAPKAAFVPSAIAVAAVAAVAAAGAAAAAAAATDAVAAAAPAPFGGARS
ncbi:hypothetical protein [Streptomyces sp. 8N616]|uniref:hypothetical protein n=1 Tax=Streptomyces sp. 8N616 TaxID=3457414 RepID=UPI003FD2A0B8